MTRSNIVAHSPTAADEKKPVSVMIERSGEEIDIEPVPHLHAKTFLAVLAAFLIYFTQSFCIVGTGSQGLLIATHFQRPQDAAWTTAPITIGIVVLGPIVSQASDCWGRKRFLIVCTLFGVVGSIIAARASSIGMVIAGSTIIGMAYGAQPLLHTIPSEVVPRRWRSWAQASDMISISLGAIVSLVIVGAVNRHGNPDGFRIFYYVSMALFAVSSIMCVFAYQPLPTTIQSTYSFSEKIARLDWIGYVLLASSLVLFCMGLSWSQNPYEWTDPHTSAPFAIGLALGLGLVLYEVMLKKDGIFHHGLFTTNRNYAIVLICIFCEGFAFFSANIYFTFQVNVLYEQDFLLVVIRYALSWVATLVASFFAGFYSALTKKVRWVTTAAFVLFVAFFICMATSNKNTSNAVWGYVIIEGWALGMTLITLITAAQLSIPPDLLSIASGMIISVRSIGGTIGVAVFNAVFIAATKSIPSNVAKAAIAAGLPPESASNFTLYVTSHNDPGLAQVPGATANVISAGINALLDTYTQGFRNVWVTSAAFIAIAAVASAFLIDPSKEFNNHIDAPVEKEEELYSS